MNIKKLDHIVITTKDLAQCVYFYEEILQLKHIISDGQHAFLFGEQKINIHTRAGEFQPAAANISYGSQDFCFITEEDIHTVKSEIEAKGWTIIEGVVERKGALGRMMSIYMYDPDGNLVEIAEYLPK